MAERWLNFARQGLRMAGLALPGGLSEGMPDRRDAEEALVIAAKVLNRITDRLSSATR